MSGQATSNQRIPLSKFNELLMSAKTIIETKALMLPMILSADGEGWTAAYSCNQLLGLLGIAPSGSQNKRLKQFLNEMERHGLVEIRIISTRRAAFRFTYNTGNIPQKADDFPLSAETGEIFPKPETGDFPLNWGNIPQLLNTGEILPYLKRDDFPLFLPERGKSPQIDPPKGENLPKFPPRPESESTESESVKSESVLTVRDLLKSVGMGENNWHVADGYSVEEVFAIVEKAKLPGVNNRAGYVFKSLKEGKEDNAFARVKSAYEKHIGAMTQSIFDSVTLALKKYPLEWIVEAIEENKHQNWGKAEQTLKLWFTNGRKSANPTGTPFPSKVKHPDFIQLTPDQIPTEQDRWALIRALEAQKS